MKCVRFPSLFFLSLVLAIWALTPLAAVAHPSGYDDHYVSGGDVCQVVNASSKTAGKLRRIHGALKNTDEENWLQVSCPIFTKTLRPDQLPGDNYHPPVDILVDIRFLNSHPQAHGFRCTFSTIGMDGEATVKSIQKRRILSGEADNIGFVFEGVTSEATMWQPLHVNCGLPPLSAILTVMTLHVGSNDPIE